MNYTVLMTNSCNLSCKYCFLSNKKEKKVTIDTLDSVLNFIVLNERAADDIVSVVVYGGEPLLAFEEMVYFVLQIKSHPLLKDKTKLHLTTNGTLLFGEKATFLEKYFDSISLSIDGTKDSHDCNRVFVNGIGSYDVVSNNISKFLKRTNKTVIGRMTVNTANVSKLEQNVLHLLSLGFNKVEPVVDQFDCWDAEKLELLESQAIRLVDYLISNPRVDIGFIADAAYRCKNIPCTGGKSSFTIDTDGSIYPCVVSLGLPEYQIGNIFYGVDRKAHDKLVSKNLEHNTCCSGCARYEYCEGTRCKIINRIQTGDWHTPAMIICELQNIKTRTARYYLDRRGEKNDHTVVKTVLSNIEGKEESIGTLT